MCAPDEVLVCFLVLQHFSSALGQSTRRLHIRGEILVFEDRSNGIFNRRVLSPDHSPFFGGGGGGRRIERKHFKNLSLKLTTCGQIVPGC